MGRRNKSQMELQHMWKGILSWFSKAMGIINAVPLPTKYHSNKVSEQICHKGLRVRCIMQYMIINLQS